MKLSEDQEYLDLLLQMQERFPGHFVSEMKAALRKHLGIEEVPVKTTPPPTSSGRRKPRQHTKFFSPEARARIAAGQRARWAKLKASGEPLMSAEAREKMRQAWERRRATTRTKAGAA